MRKRKRQYIKKNVEYWEQGDKALPAPPSNRAILEPKRVKSRQCEYCLTFCDSVYCPNCGKVTRLKGGTAP